MFDEQYKSLHNFHGNNSELVYPNFLIPPPPPQTVQLTPTRTLPIYATTSPP
jgi:hypothetical protein